MASTSVLSAIVKYTGRSSFDSNRPYSGRVDARSVDRGFLAFHSTAHGRANGSHVKLRGRGPRAEVRAARGLPATTFAEPSGDLQAA